MTREKKTDLIHIAVIALAFVAVYILLFKSWLDENGDNAAYMELARNLAAFKGYATEGPGGVWTPASHFPPGYPFFLSLFMLLGIDNLMFFKILNGVLMFSSVVLLYFVGCRVSGSRALAFSVGILTAVNPFVIRFANIVMSEMLFMFLIALVLHALVKQEDSPRRFGPWFWTAALAAAYAYYVRAVGAALVFGVLVWYLTRKDWKRAALSTGVSVAAVLPWTIRNRICGVGRSYIAPILAKNPWRPELGQISSVQEFADKVWVNFNDTALKGFRVILFPNWTGYAEKVTASVVVIGLILVVMVLYGLYKTGPLRFTLPAIMLANMAFLLVWNGQNDIRYVTPFIPLVFFGFWNCVYQIACRLWKKVRRKPLRFLPYAVALCALMCIPVCKKTRANLDAGINERVRNYYDSAIYLNSKLSVSNKPVVACRKPNIFKYYAPKAIAVSYPFVGPDEFLDFVLDQNVEYLIYDILGYNSTSYYLYPFYNRYKMIFDEVRQFGNDETKVTYILHVNRVSAMYMKHYNSANKNQTSK